jgi:hypothetical protein
VYEGEKPFQIETTEPSEDQVKLIPEKVDDIYNIFKEAINGSIIFNRNHIVPYTSFYGWGLEKLKTRILTRS